MSPKPAWQHTLYHEIVEDPHVTGRYGFTVTDPDADIGEMDVFESGLVYGSRAAAEQAADDACHLAWKWRAMNERAQR